MMCVFCSIIAHEAPAHLVFHNEHVIAFLDRTPLFHGHVLVVPRKHVVTLADLLDVTPLFDSVKRLSASVPRAMKAQGSFVAMNNVVSQSVPHLHVHVVPRTKGDGLKGFFWPRKKYAEGEMEATAEAVRKDLESTR